MDKWKWDHGGKLKPATLNIPPFKEFAKECKKLGLSRKQIEEQYQYAQAEEIYINSKYQVNVRRDVATGFEGGTLTCTHLSIKRIDKEPIHDWRDLQSIKNELVGEESEAVELYPAMSRIVDGANQFHLWCFPEGVFLPVGYTNSEVHGGDPFGGKGKQRKFKG